MNTPTFEDLGGKTWELRRSVDLKDPRWTAFNPSISYSPVEGYAILFRSSNYFYDPSTDRVTGTGVGKDPGLIENRLWFGYLNKDLEIIEDSLKEVFFNQWEIPMYRGVEDARLFWRNDGWEFTATVYEPHVFHYPRIGKFKLENYEATIINFYLSAPKESFQSIEKNWMPTDNLNLNFDYIYSQTSVYSNLKGVTKVRSKPEENLRLRGGSQLLTLDNESYLAVVHETDIEKADIFNRKTLSSTTDIRKYYHRFARYSSEGVLSGVSDRFKFNGFHIEFAAGIVVKNDSVAISYGVNDMVSMLGTIDLSKVLELIKDV